MHTWVLLRGLTRSSGHWMAFPRQFLGEFPDARVLTLDLPGNGALHLERSPTRVLEMVQSCRAQLAQRAVAPPYHLLAMSLGGMVAVAWSREHAHEVAAQVLINTSMRPFSSFYQRLLPRNYPALLRLALGDASALDWERALLRMTSNLAGPQVLATWLALREKNPVSRANALRQLLAAARFCAAPSASVPTLVLASAHDRLVASACSRALARRWACELRLHPEAGHDLALDDGPWVARQVRQWLGAAAAGAMPDNDREGASP